MDASYKGLQSVDITDEQQLSVHDVDNYQLEVEHVHKVG